MGPQESASSPATHLGPQEPCTWHQQALALKEKNLAHTMPNAAGTLQKLGDDYMKVCEYDKALAFCWRKKI